MELSSRIFHLFNGCVDRLGRVQEIVFLMGDAFSHNLHIFPYAWLDSGYVIMRQFGISHVFCVKVDLGF